jgi:ABC-type lipoprotein export system ATPase subunit
VTAN